MSSPSIYDFLNKEYVKGFLDSSRNGSAHNFRNQSLKHLIESMSLSTLFFLIQLFFFNIIKNIIPEIYQPNLLLCEMKKKIYSKSNEKSEDDLNRGMTSVINENSNTKSKFWKLGFGLKWVILLHNEDIEQFENLGLDSFYFLKFLFVLQKFFGILSAMITPTLGFLHYYYSTKSTEYGKVKIKGLEKLSIYSLTVHNTNLLAISFCCTIIIVIMFHWMLKKEIQFVIEKKLKFLKYIQTSYDSIKSKDTFQADTLNANNQSNLQSDILFIKNMHRAHSTILIHDAPMWSHAKLNQLLAKLKDKNNFDIFYIPVKIKHLMKYQKNHVDIIKQIEKIELDNILENFFIKHNDKVELYFKTMINKYRQQKNPFKVMEYQGKWFKYIKSRKLYKIKFIYNIFKFNIKINKKSFYLKKIKVNYYALAISLFQNKNNVNKLEYISKKIKKYLKNLNDWKNFRKEIEQSYTKQLYQQTEPYETIQLIVKFDNVYEADFFCQLLIYSSPGYFTQIERNINFNHLIWENIVFSNSYIKFLSHCLVNILQCFIMIGWSVPVAILGVIFQTPYVAKFVPLIRSLYKMPKLFLALISSFVPIITLIILTDLVPECFRFLLKHKNFSSSNKVEINLQKWFYVFSFLQIFIVVTISSGITIIFEQVITNPTSIPNILATNFPQCSNFFVSFIYLRGLAYCMGNFIQWGRLLEYTFKNYLWITSKKTPRAQFEKLSKDSLIYKWGSVYPIFTLMASITIIYSIIQPIILPVAFIAFTAVLMSFKFSIKYQVNRANNKLETMGEFYPTALFQLYSGIYCLEGFMIGLFLISKKIWLCILMFSVLVASIVAHCHLSTKYQKLLNNLPLSDYEPEKSNVNTNEEEKHTSEMGIPGNLSALYYEKDVAIVPFADPDNVNSVIWLPNDVFGESDQEIDRLKFLFGKNLRITNLHASIDSCGNVQINS
ncbi:uncharacterized protein HGUI_03094 [Hanseniaspora guilliermondii]|uniref:DUF221-domain-containing protein n=1 Tax=Hanseniaspora guilliermondii TaxID=56406 RepID=A0A1L0FMW1_9ASCO|nr:uncharacterized protein HGUI_03094 [Hanseniaspora guilliermondii]